MSWTVLVPEALVGLLAFGTWLAPPAPVGAGRTRLPARAELPALAAAVLLVAWIVELSAGSAVGLFFHGGFVQDRLALDAKAFLLLAAMLAVLLTDWEIVDHSSHELSLLLWACFGGLVAASAGSLAGVWAGTLLALVAALAALAGVPARIRAAAGGPSLTLGLTVGAAALMALAAVGLAFLYASAGESDLSGIAAHLPEGTTTGTLAVASIAALTGLGAALVGGAFLLRGASAWPLEASLATGPAAGLAAGAAAVAVLRLLAAVIGSAAAWSPYLAVLAALLLAAGGLGAIGGRSVRGLVGWLACLQVGWIVAGLAVHQRAAVGGSLFLLGVFLLAACGAAALLGEDLLDRLGSLSGLAAPAPLVAVGLAVPLLSLAGVPPLGGWFGVFAVAAPLAGGGYFWLLAVGLGASLLALVAGLRVIWLLFLTPAPEVVRPPLNLLRATGAVLLILAVIGFGFFANPLHGLAFQGAEALRLP